MLQPRWRPWLTGIVKWGLGLALALYLGVLGLMFLAQRQLQYFPDPTDHAPESVGLQGVSVIDLRAADGVASALWYAPAQGQMPVILFFHGNAGSVADRAPRMRAYLSQGYGAAFLSYRGFGPSPAPITEAGLLADAEAAYGWLRAKGIAPVRLIAAGESLGTGVAVQMAARHPFAAVALAAPYTSTADVAAALYPWLPVRLLMQDQFRSDLHIGKITAPILIQHGDADQVVPYRFGRNLHALAGPGAEFVPLKGQGHEAIFAPETFAREMAFFARTLPNQPSLAGTAPAP